MIGMGGSSTTEQLIGEGRPTQLGPGGTGTNRKGWTGGLSTEAPRLKQKPDRPLARAPTSERRRHGLLGPGSPPACSNEAHRRRVEDDEDPTQHRRFGATVEGDEVVEHSWGSRPNGERVVGEDEGTLRVQAM